MIPPTTLGGFMTMPFSRLFPWSYKVLDLILPPRCMGCGDTTLQHHILCASCWKQCSFLSPPWCSICGWSLPFEIPEQSLCPRCHRFLPLFVQCRSAFTYEEKSRSIILRFKHGDGTYLAPGLAILMLRVGQEILSSTDLLIPVPLHWKRLFIRQYNQAALLSYQLSRLTGITTETKVLKRKRATLKQGHQTAKERYANVKGAFIILPHKKHEIVGKSVTLIDDVLTTGATINECSRVLLNAGAKEVRILTLARVITSL